MNDNETYDLAIVGTGAAGLAAALYAGRYRMKVIAFGKDFGGETATAGVIWNYPGAKGVDGYELMKIMKEQAEELGAQIFNDEVTALSNDDGCFTLRTKKGAYKAATVILAVGTERRHLGIPREKELTGRGVHYCVTCDGPLYTGKRIAIVGGGDASVKGANLAAEYAEKIYLITIEKELHAEPINLEVMRKYGDKIEVIHENTVTGFVGDGPLDAVTLQKPYQGAESLEVSGLFVEIGAVPNVSLAKNIGVDLDEAGYIKADNMMKTNIPGVFAAGDTVNLFGRFKQAVTAAAMGAVAATSAYEYRKVHGDVCLLHGKVQDSK